MTGNAVVAKPAPTTPLTTLLFGELAQSILPVGILNIICDQNELGPLLTGHKDIAKVAFTGSTATGKKVIASSAGTMKRVTLELGGNDAAIVLDDVDPRKVAHKIYQGAMMNAGQICVAISHAWHHADRPPRSVPRTGPINQRNPVALPSPAPSAHGDSESDRRQLC